MTKPSNIHALLSHIGARLDANDPAVVVRTAGVAFDAHVAMPIDSEREIRLARDGSMSVWINRAETGAAPSWAHGPVVRTSFRQRLTVRRWVRRVLRMQAEVDQAAILDAIQERITNVAQ